MPMKKFLLSLTVALMAVCGAKAEEQVLFEGSEALSWGGIAMEKMSLTSTSDVTMSVTIESTSGIWWQFKFVCSNVEGWPSINLLGKDAVTASDVTYNWVAGTYKYEFDLTEEQIASAKDGLTVQGGLGEGDGQVYLKKVVVMDKLKYQDAANIAFDEYGNILAEAFNGYSDNAKVTFTWTSENITGYNNYGAGSLASLDGSVKTSISFNIKNEGENFVSCTLADLKDALNAPKDQYDRNGLYWNMWSCGGENKNTRVSITIAEVEGFTGEGYKAPSSSSIKTIGSESEEASAINLFGQPVNEAKGLMIKGGKKVYVK